MFRDNVGSKRSHGQESNGISMGGKGFKGLVKEVTKLHKGVIRFEKKFERFQKKGKRPLKDVNMVESSNKTKKDLDMDIEEKESIEEGKSSSKLLVGKQTRKGVAHQTMQKFEEEVYIRVKSLYKKWKQATQPHITKGLVDETGMVQAKKSVKLNHLVTITKVKRKVQDI